MWLRYAICWLLAIMAVLPASTAAAASPVSMQGQGAVVSGRATQQLRLKFTSDAGTNWILEIAVNPVQTGYSRSGQVVTLSGTFTLGLDNEPLAQGTASGILNPDGTGDIKLNDSAGTSLDVNYTIASADNIGASVQGQWPSIPSAGTGTAVIPTSPLQTHFFWFLSRTAGVLAYLLFFTTICFGLLQTVKQSNRVMAKWQSLDLHKFVALLGVGFLILHIFSLLGDHYFNFSVGQLLFPANEPYRPVPVAVGIISLWSVVVIFVAFQARRVIGRGAWRLLHPAATLLFFAALFHAVTAGTDSSLPWIQWMYVLTAGIAVFALVTQLTARFSQNPRLSPLPVHSEVYPPRRS